MLNLYIQSWFSRHKSNDAMIPETLNEEPTFDKIHHESFVVNLLVNLFGFIQDKNESIIGVSPNIIAVITKEDGTQVMSCAEIKLE